MPKKCIKFIPEYLIPNLNNKRFGERLKWIDKSKKIFEIDWPHKAGPLWTEQGATVFVEWDKHKGHFNPENKQYFTESKQRFRALLYKLTRDGQLQVMKSNTKFKKVYCIICEKKKTKRKKTYLNAEYEYCNEGKTSPEQEYEDSDDICRTVSEDVVVNVLEDHSYTYTLHENFRDVLMYDTENEQMTLNMQDILVPTLSNKATDNFQKRVLMDRNRDNINISGPVASNFHTENFPLFENLSDWSENTTVSVLTAYQNIPISIFADDVNSSQLDPWELLQMDQNHDIKK